MRIKKKHSHYLYVFLFIFLSWIYLQGTIHQILEKNLVPVTIPEELINLNRKLSQINQDYKALWLPPQFDARSFEWLSDRTVYNFLADSSGLATISPYTNYAKLYFTFLKQFTVNHVKAPHFLDILNAKFLILRQDFDSQYSDLLETEIQKEQSFQQIDIAKWFRLWQNNAASSHLWVPAKYNLVVGGMESLDILNSQNDFDLKNNAIIFLNQTSGLINKIKDLPSKNLIFNNTSKKDLTFSLIENQYLIAPTGYTNGSQKEWQPASVYDPLHGEWHRIIDPIRVPNWDFDFNKGLAYTGKANFEINLPLSPSPNEDNYILLIRYYQSHQGGWIQISSPAGVTKIKTLDRNNKFITQDFAINYQKKQPFNLKIKNLNGFNAVNLVALVPESQYQAYSKQAEQIIDQSQVTYLQKITPELVIEPFKLNLPKEGEYQTSVRFKRNLVKKEQNYELNNSQETIQNEKTDTSNPGKEKIISLSSLTKQKMDQFSFFFQDHKYSLPLTEYNNLVWYPLDNFSFPQKGDLRVFPEPEIQNVLTLDNFFVLDKGNLNFRSLEIQNFIKLEKTDENKILTKISSNPSVPDREGRIISDAIAVEPDHNFYLEYDFQGEQLMNVDARVLFYGEDYDPIYQRKAFKVDQIMGNQIGIVSKKKIFDFFSTPPKTHYFKIEFKAETNFEADSWFEISNFKLLQENDLDRIDAILLKKIESQNQLPIKQSSVNLQYKKINPTQYKVSFNDTSTPFILAFAESYNPLWHIKKPDSNHKKLDVISNQIRSLFSKNNQNNEYSFPLYSVINGFYINPNDFPNHEFILEYEPQNWYQIGVIITVISIITSLIIWLIYALLSKFGRLKSKKISLKTIAKS